MCLISAVSELPRYVEAVLSEEFSCLIISRRRSAVEKINMVRSVLDTAPEHVDHASFCNLALEPS